MASDFKEAEVWQHLNPGDTIDLVAPGSACSHAELTGAAKFVKSLGLKPRYAKDIFARKSPILSSSDDRRFYFLKKALLAKDSTAIWCLRGGYGSIRLLPELTKLAKPKQVKLIIGYSDVTTLHNYVNFFWQWPSLHGPLLDRFAAGRNTAKELSMMKAMLFGEKKEFSYSNLRPLNAAALKVKTIKSTVVGGNQAVLQASLGTPWQMNPEDKILFLEDIGEKAHRVDRMLVQMSQSGYFAKAKAIILGDYVIANNVDRRRIWNLALRPFAQQCKIPVLSGIQCGHGKVQLPLPFFTPATLKLSPQGGGLVIKWLCEKNQ